MEKLLSLDNVELYYTYGLSLEQGGEAEAALGVYEKIMLIDFAFKDVDDRRKKLSQEIAGGKAAVREAGENTGEEIRVGAVIRWRSAEASWWRRASSCRANPSASSVSAWHHPAELWTSRHFSRQ